MALTPAQKMAIAAHYAPILYFHPDERFFPIRPEYYIQRAALWRGHPDTDKKGDWGEGGPGFPRRPRIPHSGISLDPSHDIEGTADPDRDGVNEWYLGHRHRDGTQPYLRSDEVWLDSSGWQDSSEVTDSSINNRCNPDAAHAKWQEPSNAIARTFSDWYNAEVEETSDLQRLLISLGEIDGKSVEIIMRELLGEIWIAWYYFLYPIHEEYLRRCEQIFEDAEKRGDYEGDWNAIAVVIRRPAILPWEQGGAFDQPLYIGYGVRLRGIAEDISPNLFTQGMVVRRWDDAPHIGTHPRIFVAKGYHNNYWRGGDHSPPDPKILNIAVGKISCEISEEIDEGVNSIIEALEDVAETSKDIIVTVAKIVAGGGIGFDLFGPPGALIGAAAGAIAGIAEALSTSNTDDVPSEEVRQELEKEPAPPVGRYGLVLKPSEVADPLFHDPAHRDDPEKDETAVTIRAWNGTDLQRLVDGSQQVWWSYNGRWGVRVQNDPNNRRSGIQFPKFKAALLNNIAVHLQETEEAKLP